MSILSRKPTAPAPGELIDQIRTAQAEHAAAVTDANQRLVETHDAVFNQANDRKRTLREQIKLLGAEIEGLNKVTTVASALPQGVEAAPAPTE